MTKKEILKAERQKAIKAMFAPCKNAEKQFTNLLNKLGVNPTALRGIA